MSQIDILLGKSIAEQRVKIGISQKELANRLNLSTYSVAAFEQGSRRATASQLFDIAEILDLKVERLFGCPDSEPVETKPSETPFAGDVDSMVGHYDALSKTHRAAIFAFLLALKPNNEENPEKML